MPDTYTLPALSAAQALSRAKDGARLVDIRKVPARANSGRTVRGAELRDPFTFGHADPLLESDQPLIVFCVHGHEVSQFACALMLVHGCEAAYVSGGFEALVEAGAELEELSK